MSSILLIVVSVDLIKRLLNSNSFLGSSILNLAFNSVIFCFIVSYSKSLICDSLLSFKILIKSRFNNSFKSSISFWFKPVYISSKLLFINSSINFNNFTLIEKVSFSNKKFKLKLFVCVFTFKKLLILSISLSFNVNL